MSDPLPPDKLDKLLPALKHLAEMMQKSSNVDTDGIELLLLGVGLEEEWAVDEVQRWKKILSSVRGQTDASKREFAQRALSLRGIPEAHAMLAVSIVAEPEKPPASPVSLRLGANIERLDFGVIPVGQAVDLEFEVQGGPGRIVADSDQLEVTPLQFNSDLTRIRVEVKPFVGDTLWTNLKLIAGGETLEIPVLAQREKPLPPLAPAPPQSPDVPIDRAPTPSSSYPNKPVVPKPTPVPGPWLPSGISELRTLTGHTATVYSIDFSPDGRYLVSGGSDGTVRLWEVASGREVRRLDGDGSTVYAVAFSHDGSRFATGGRDNVVRLWEINRFRNLRVFDGNTEAIRSLAFSGNGIYLAAGTTDGKALVWEVISGRLIAQHTSHMGSINCIGFSSNDDYLAYGEEGAIQIFETVQNRLIRTVTTDNEVKSLGFSNDGLILAAGLRDEKIRLWDFASGQVIRQLNAHTSIVMSIEFNPSGGYLASGSADWTIRLWEVSSGRMLYSVEKHTASVCCVTFSPDGDILASAGGDCSIKLWQIT